MPVTNGFVGRERELALLRTHMDRALGGKGGLVLLTGEPGIGKTRTADELARLARLQRAKVLWGRCLEGEEAPALWPWTQILRTYVRERDPGSLRVELGSAAGVIAEVIPDLAAKLPGVAAPPRLEPPNARRRLFDATTWFLRRAAGAQPLVLIVDDIQWADRPSVVLLEQLAARVGDARMLVVAAMRDTRAAGASAASVRALAELAALPTADRLELPGLSPDEVGQLIGLSIGEGGSAALARVVHRQTGGNPFFVRELIRVLLADGRLETVAAEETPLHAVATQVRDVIVRRVLRLSAFCQTLLESAAVLGREFSLPALAGMSGLPGERLVDALQEAADAGLVAADRHVAGAWRFVHPIVAETLHAELGPAVRVRLHQRAADVLEGLVETGAFEEPPFAELAHHFLEASRGPASDKVIDYTVRAADHASRQLAFETAADRYELAFDALDPREERNRPRRLGLLLRLGEARRWAGEVAGAKGSYLLAAELARQVGDPERLALAALGFAGPTPVVDDTVEQATVNLLEEALEALEALGADDGQMRALVLGRLATELVPERKAGARRAALSGEALSLARRLDDTALLGAALAARRKAVWSPDNLEERRALSAEIVAVAGERDDPELDMLGRRWLIADLMECGELGDAQREMDAYARRGEQLRQPLDRWVSAVHRTNRALLAGRFADAGTHAAIALAHGRAAVGAASEIEHAAAMFWICREQGRLAEAEAALTAVVDSGSGDPAIGMLRCWLVTVRAELGREPDARAALELLAGEGFASLPRDAYWLGSVAALAEACALLGDTKRGAELYDLARPFADHNAVPGNLPCGGSVERYLGLLAATDGRFEAAMHHFDRAIAANGELGARPLVAWSQHDHAAMLRSRGRLDDAERVLALAGDAGRTARELGMTRLEQRVGALRSFKGMNRSSAKVPGGSTPKVPSGPTAKGPSNAPAKGPSSPGPTVATGPSVASGPSGDKAPAAAAARTAATAPSGATGATGGPTGERPPDRAPRERPPDQATGERPRDRAGGERPPHEAARPPKGKQPDADGLTRREVEVLRLLATGRSNRAIADELVVTVSTVERHLVNLYRKIGASDRAGATRYARRRNLGPAPARTPDRGAATRGEERGEERGE
jgi:DNA-binding CsgD family transcriptional regulator/tetratricopeptide (TPR) repeat protein